MVNFSGLKVTPVSSYGMKVRKNSGAISLPVKTPSVIMMIINTATPEKMMIIKDKYYFPNNSLLVICGDVNQLKLLHKPKKFLVTGNTAVLIRIRNILIPEFKPISKTELHYQRIIHCTNTLYDVSWQGPDYKK